MTAVYLGVMIQDLSSSSSPELCLREEDWLPVAVKISYRTVIISFQRKFIQILASAWDLRQVSSWYMTWDK